ncbi:MAG: ComF family protein [Cyanobacteria bacterium SZAS LIN-3]|nr:ComF family protein [Cyanobacteria bacterium SZAS LIN-3]
MSMLKLAMGLPGRLWRLVTLLLFEPPCCGLCQVDTTEGELCNHCRSFFSELEPVRTTLIGDDDNDVIECLSCGYYSGPLQEAVYQIKYLKRPELARILSFALLPPAVALLETGEGEKPVLVPVPLHAGKRRERGFNQAEELAFHLGRELNLKMDNTSLLRTRATRPQFGLSRGQRRRNLQGAFAASKSLAGQNVILVDDVLTSGATIYECALSVARAGGNVVGAITLARARWQKRSHADETDSTTVPEASFSLVL